MKIFHIAAASDQNYICHIAALLQSIIKNTTSDTQIIFHLLSNSISNDSLNALLFNTSKKLTLKKYDISDLSKHLHGGIPQTIALTSYARLFLPSILPEDIDRVLYLDCDTIINRSLDELFDLDMEDYAIAGVLDTLPDDKAKIAINLKTDDPYVNAGVLVINLKFWRDNYVQNSFMDYLTENNGVVYHHDQGIINHVLKGKILIIDPRYNLTSNYFSHPYSYLFKSNFPFYKENEILLAKNNPVIIHFTEGFLARPWIRGSKHPLKNVYTSYKMLTKWGSAPLEPDTRPWHVKLLAYEFIHFPKFIYEFTCALANVIKHIRSK